MRHIVRDVSTSVSEWRTEAAALGVSATEINRMATAFDHHELDEARRYAA